MLWLVPSFNIGLLFKKKASTSVSDHRKSLTLLLLLSLSPPSLLHFSSHHCLPLPNLNRLNHSTLFSLLNPSNNLTIGLSLSGSKQLIIVPPPDRLTRQKRKLCHHHCFQFHQIAKLNTTFSWNEKSLTLCLLLPRRGPKKERDRSLLIFWVHCFCLKNWGLIETVWANQNLFCN